MSNNEPGIGHNVAPDYAQRVTDQMQKDYQALADTVEGAELNGEVLLGRPIESDDDMAPVAAAVKRMRDLVGRLEAFHQKEKEPHLRAGQAVDGFFFKLIDRIAKRNKTANHGVADKLQAHVDSYMQRKRAEEAERRRLAQEEANKKAEEERQRAAQLAFEAEQAKAAAERARRKRDEKNALAREAEINASTQNVKTFLAEDAEHAAEVSAAASPADMVRTRLDGGVMATMAQETYAEVFDTMALDKEILWPFINADAKVKALRQWARTTDFREQMAGANIGRRPKTVIR